MAQVILATALGFACVEDLAGAVLWRYDLGISKSTEMNTHDLPSQAWSIHGVAIPEIFGSLNPQFYY